MEVKAWYAREFGADWRYKPVLPGDTHVKMPVSCCTQEAKEEFAACEEAFGFFNWYGGSAPEGVREFVRANKIHTSMSVGDICQIDDHFFMVESFGFRRLHERYEGQSSYRHFE